MNSISQEYPSTRNYEKDLSSLLAVIVLKEHQLELQRCLLSENDKFDIIEAFRTLDSHGHGYLTPGDLSSFLSKNHIIIRDRECEFLTYVVASNHTSITLKEFLNLLLPKFNDLLKEQCLERRKFRPSSQKPSIPFYIEEQIANILSLEIEFIRETEEQKMELMNNYGWNFRESFKRIAAPETYQIDQKAFSTFMLSNQHKRFNEDSFKYLLTRFNKDCNNVITMDEFCHAIFPSNFISDTTDKSFVQGPFARYVKGEESEFRQYLTGRTDIFQSEQKKEKFTQQDFQFNNEIPNNNNNNTNNAQPKQSLQHQSSSRKFLKTSLQYENPKNLRPAFEQQQQQREFDRTAFSHQQQQQQQQYTNYPILDQYMHYSQVPISQSSNIKYLYQAPSSYSNAPASPLQHVNNNPHFRSNQFLKQQPQYQNSMSGQYQTEENLATYQNSQRSPLQYLSQKKNLYLDYDIFSSQKEQQPELQQLQQHNFQKSTYHRKESPQNSQPSRPLNSQNYQRNSQQQQSKANEHNEQLANSYLVKSQIPPSAEHIFRKSMPSLVPIGQNASTAKFHPNSRSQITGDLIQPFNAKDFTKSRYEPQ